MAVITVSHAAEVAVMTPLLRSTPASTSVPVRTEPVVVAAATRVIPTSKLVTSPVSSRVTVWLVTVEPEEI